MSACSSSRSRCWRRFAGVAVEAVLRTGASTAGLNQPFFADLWMADIAFRGSLALVGRSHRRGLGGMGGPAQRALFCEQLQTPISPAPRDGIFSFGLAESHEAVLQD
jgi:hypothetical protein